MLDQIYVKNEECFIVIPSNLNQIRNWQEHFPSYILYNSRDLIFRSFGNHLHRFVRNHTFWFEKLVLIPGSYRCICPYGYQLAPDGRHCIDINECTSEANDCRYDLKSFISGNVLLLNLFFLGMIAKILLELSCVFVPMVSANWVPLMNVKI